MTEQTVRSARLWAVDHLIFASGTRGITSAEIARRLGCSQRTVQRDIAAVESDLNRPLVYENGRYSMMPGTRELAPVRFSLQEARALMLATRLFLRYADERDPDGMAALEKLSEVLPPTVAAQLQLTLAQLGGRPQRRERTEVVRRLTEAWSSSRTVVIDYRSQRTRDIEQTRLDPFILEPSATGSATYVVGFSHQHGEIRTFKLDRVVTVEVTPEGFEPPDVADLSRQLGESWGGVVLAREEHRVVIDFNASVADRVRETYWHPSQELEELDNGAVRLRLRLPSLLDFTPWVLGWGAEASVVAPPELRAEVAARFREAAARYA